MDFSFTQEQRQLRQSVLDFAKSALNGDLAKRDQTREFPRDLWKQCAEFGILGLPIPSEWGGRGLDMVSVFYALEGLGYGCRDNGLVFSMHAHLWGVAMPLLLFGTPDQKKKYLPRLCNGTMIGSIAMAEPESGSDAFNLKTRAVKKGAAYVLNGSKTLITNAPVAGLYLVFAAVEPPGPVGVTAFLIERAAPGLTVGRTLETMGLRSSPLGELSFQDCEVPAQNLLGKAGDGPAIFTGAMELERCGIPASHVGAMERILERCVAYARERRQFGKTIGEFQAVSHKVAEMRIRLETSRLLVYRAAWLKSQGKHALLEASITKAHVGDAYIQTCLDAVQIFGGRGYLTESELERELRDAIPSRIYSGTSEIQKKIIAGWLGL
ncbi:MAG: acyl-CoA dehydrogenase family protein [Nitrospirae bacterium]|nr:acyl-CoA dehydrogenase family protein [Nitrospirota bacterium]